MQQQIRLLEQQKEQQQQLQQLQLPEQQQDELMMLRARSPLSRLSDELIMPRRMFQADRMLDAMMPVPIVAMKIDTIDQISPLSLLNQISNSIMQNPLLPLSESPILAFLLYLFSQEAAFIYQNSIHKSSIHI